MRWYNKSFLIFFALSSLALADAGLRAKIEAIIRVRHPQEAGETRATWLALGKDAPPVIREMARETTSTADKMRLTQGLAWFGEPADLEWIKNEARKTEKSVVRNNAIRTVVATRGAAESAFYSEFLQHPDAQTRVEAARALKKSGDFEGVKKWEEAEPVDWVKQRARGEKRVTTAPKAPLPMRSSSDLKFSREFLGTWSGTATFKEKTLLSRESSLEVVAPAEEISFLLKLPDAQYAWTTFSGQGSVFVGEWILKGTGPGLKRIPGQLSLLSHQGQTWVEFSSKQLPWHAVWLKK